MTLPGCRVDKVVDAIAGDKANHASDNRTGYGPDGGPSYWDHAAERRSVIAAQISGAKICIRACADWCDLRG